MELTRKQFLVLVIGGAAVAACGGSESTPAGPAGNCAANGTTAAIGANHGHVLVVPEADVVAGVEKTYDITGSATHPHLVTLTAAHMAALQQNLQASVVSTNDDGHSHSVKVSCA